MQISVLLELYIASNRCGPRYVECLRRTTRKAEASGLQTTCQLDPLLVNRFLAGMSSLSSTTRANIRREILTLWRWGFEAGFVPHPPQRVIRFRPDRRPVRAWTAEDLQRMLSLAESDATAISERVTLLRSDVLPAWIGIGYDTALRFGDILSLARCDFVAGGDAISLTARKTGKPLVRRLSEYTQLAVKRLFSHSPDNTLFAWCLPRKRAQRVWRDFLADNHLAGSQKWLRRSAATALERMRPGSAMHFLQHSSPHLVINHYLDQTHFAVPQGPPPLRPR